MSVYTEKIYEVIDEIQKAVIGKEDRILKVMMALLAKGHILMDDIPGVGKTTLALAFSKVLGLGQNRIQFTPDVLPADVIGFSMYQRDTGNFIYQPGPIMCNLLLADEINRTSPKTQSALLEVMEEGNVTVDGVTRKVPLPFIVMATQNPVGSAGTQKLPESQLDRFMICMSMGYPDLADEIVIIKGRNSANPIDSLQPLLNGKALIILQEKVEEIFIHDSIFDYIVKLVSATRYHPMLELGISPRGSVALTRMVKAKAFLTGRSFAEPDDVMAVFKDVGTHRIRLNAKARAALTTPEDILNEIMQQTKRPAPGQPYEGILL